MLHCDKHLVKMILESTQMLYMVHALWGQRITARVQVKGEEKLPYKVGGGHMHHPCTLWAAGCKTHYYILLNFAMKLADRYALVFSNGARKEHACVPHLKSIAAHSVASHVPDVINANDWISWIEDTFNLTKESIANTKRRIATRNPPAGAQFGVTCIDSDTLEQCQVIEDGELDLVETYRQYYGFKHNERFKMKWGGCDLVPSALEDAITSFSKRQRVC